MSKTLENLVTQIESPHGLGSPLYADEVMMISHEVNENYVALAEKGAEAILASQSAQARIAELTAEVAKYKAALELIANPDSSSDDDQDIARNALKEGLCKCGPFHGAHHATCKAAK